MDLQIIIAYALINNFLLKTKKDLRRIKLQKITKRYGEQNGGGHLLNMSKPYILNYWQLLKGQVLYLGYNYNYI